MAPCGTVLSAHPGSSLVGRPDRNTYLSAHYWHLLRRSGSEARPRLPLPPGTLLVIIWHLLAGDCNYHHLGADQHDRRHGAKPRVRYYIRQLEALGHRVSLGPAA